MKVNNYRVESPCASVGDTSATAISSAENLLVRFKVSPV